MLIERATGLGFPPLPSHLLAGFFAYALSLGDLHVIQAVADDGILLLRSLLSYPHLHFKRLSSNTMVNFINESGIHDVSKEFSVHCHVILNIDRIYILSDGQHGCSVPRGRGLRR